MSQAKNFLKFISTPREIYAVLDKFGYKSGNALIRAVVQKGYAEKREHKIVLTKFGKNRLNEIENPRPVEVQPELIQEMPAPAEESKTGLWILGVGGLLGFIISIFQISLSKTFIPYGIFGIFFLILFIFSIILFFRSSR